MIFLVVLALFFGLFLVYPVSLLLKGAFIDAGRFTFKYFGMLLSSPVQRESLSNSFAIATLTTVLTTILVMPLASVLTRFDFRGKALLHALLLIPMIMPPFVGAIGLKQLLARFGSVNLLLTDLGIISANSPIDWLGHAGSGESSFFRCLIYTRSCCLTSPPRWRTSIPACAKRRRISAQAHGACSAPSLYRSSHPATSPGQSSSSFGPLRTSAHRWS